MKTNCIFEDLINESDSDEDTQQLKQSISDTFLESGYQQVDISKPAGCYD
jgi:hypothetical protein